MSSKRLGIDVYAVPKTVPRGAVCLRRGSALIVFGFQETRVMQAGSKADSRSRDTEYIIGYRNN